MNLQRPSIEWSKRSKNIILLRKMWRQITKRTCTKRFLGLPTCFPSESMIRVLHSWHAVNSLWPNRYETSLHGEFRFLRTRQPWTTKRCICKQICILHEGIQYKTSHSRGANNKSVNLGFSELWKPTSIGKQWLANHTMGHLLNRIHVAQVNLSLNPRPNSRAES